MTQDNANHPTPPRKPRRYAPGVYDTVYGNTVEYYGPDEDARDIDAGEDIPKEVMHEMIDFTIWHRALD